MTAKYILKYILSLAKVCGRQNFLLILDFSEPVGVWSTGYEPIAQGLCRRRAGRKGPRSILQIEGAKIFWWG